MIDAKEKYVFKTQVGTQGDAEVGHCGVAEIELRCSFRKKMGCGVVALSRQRSGLEIALDLGWHLALHYYGPRATFETISAGTLFDEELNHLERCTS